MRAMEGFSSALFLALGLMGFYRRNEMWVIFLGYGHRVIELGHGFCMRWRGRDGVGEQEVAGHGVWRGVRCGRLGHGDDVRLLRGWVA